MSFAPRRESVREVRRFVDQTLHDWEISSPESVLVASELATNVVLHARTDFVVSLFRSPTTVRVEVSDGDVSELSLCRSTGDQPSGRGLAIVDAVVGDWGVNPSPRGKTVWAELGAAPRRGERVAGDRRGQAGTSRS